TYSTSVTGAPGRPSAVPCCGMPAKSFCTSAPPGRAFASEPTRGTVVGGDEEPPRRTSASTIAITAARTTPTPARRTRGEARRAFDETGGGGGRRACLLRLPLGTDRFLAGGR